jgi:hypothetical protein
MNPSPGHNAAAPVRPATPALGFRLAIARTFKAASVVSLCYLLGAAAMFFHMPSSSFLAKAFEGAEALHQRLHALRVNPGRTPPAKLGRIDVADKTFDGYTLCTFATLDRMGQLAYLYNMSGRVVHQWFMPFSWVWPAPEHVPPPANDTDVSFSGCHLFGNGDILLTYYNHTEWASGYGLVKLDKESHLLWKYPACVHHDVDVAEDGTIYAIRHEKVSALPAGLERLPAPCLVDYLVALSPEGKELQPPLSLLEALQHSPYAMLLDEMKESESERLAARPTPYYPKQDMHTNSVQVLKRQQAAHYPVFRPGQVLVSIRNLDAIAVVDPERREVVWAARGPWRRQHDARFLDNGRLMIFDNLGSTLGSRVLEYDPMTQALPWVYNGGDAAPFFTEYRGMCQRLPNGNTLVVSSKQGELREVTPDKEVVWTCVFKAFIDTARRYGPAELPFVSDEPRDQ